MDNYLVQVPSQTKLSRIILPEDYGVKKILNTNSLPEKQKTAPNLKKGSEIKPRLAQGRAVIKHKTPQVTKNIDKLTDKLQEIPKIPAA